MNLRLWDFQCDACGHRYNGEPIMSEKVPKTIKCSQDGCKGRASWSSGGKQNHIHETNSRLGYGQFDPQFGCVVESYSHKKQLMRQMGLEEKKHYTHEEIAEDLHNARAEAARQESDPVLAADSVEELQKMIEEKHQTNARRGDLQEGWVM